MSTADIYAEDGYWAPVPEWVLDAEISALAVRLYAVLRRYADQSTRQAHPSRQTLAGRVRVKSLRTVDAALVELVDLGAVSTFPRFSDDGDRTSNGYILHRAPDSILQGVVQQIARPPVQPGAPPPVQPAAQELEPLEREPVETHTTAARRVGDSPAGFDEWWGLYPRKTSKGHAVRAYRAALGKTTAAVLHDSLQAYVTSLARERTETRYIAHPATWLNGERWEDQQPATPTIRPRSRDQF